MVPPPIIVPTSNTKSLANANVAPFNAILFVITPFNCHNNVAYGSIKVINPAILPLPEITLPVLEIRR